MKKILMSVIMMLLTLVAITLPSEAFASQVLDRSVKTHLGAKNASVTLRSAEKGTLLYNLNGSVPRQTASNMKLLTGAAVLQQLGEEYQYSTTLYIDGEMSGNTLNGDVYLKGSGDPTLQYANLQAIAKKLAAAGVKTVNGRVYLDDTLFTDSTLPPGSTKSEETYYYAARTSALHMSPNEDFDTGTVIVQVTGTKSGKAPSVNVLPHVSGQKIVNKAKTGSKTSLSVRRQYNTNQLVISGTIAPGRSSKTFVSVQDPTVATGHAFLSALSSAGVKVKNTALAKKATPATAQSIYVHESRTLAKMLPTYMKLSNNGMADTFIRTIAAQNRGKGTLASGLNEMRSTLATLGMPTDKLTLVDGSGLSSKNRVQSNQITSLLYNMQKQPTFNTFHQSLPVGGNANRLIGGTLKNRFTGSYANRVHAKTGYISGVYALSGYVTAKSGKTYIFSVLTENRSSSAINGIDRVVKTIIDNY